MAPVLYSFRRCPYAMRARLAIAASGLACELREVVLRDKPSELLQASPKGTVPVLVLPDGTVIEQSLDIMVWALQQSDPNHWITSRESARAYIELCDGPFKRHLDRYKYPNRYQLADGLTDRELGADFLWQLNMALQRSGFLHGTHFGFFDAALAPFVRQFAHTDLHWFATQQWDHLKVWLAEFEASAQFATAMEKYSPWAPGAEPVYFPPSTGNKL